MKQKIVIEKTVEKKSRCKKIVEWKQKRKEKELRGS